MVVDSLSCLSMVAMVQAPAWCPSGLPALTRLADRCSGLSAFPEAMALRAARVTGATGNPFGKWQNLKSERTN